MVTTRDKVLDIFSIDNKTSFQPGHDPYVISAEVVIKKVFPISQILGISLLGMTIIFYLWLYGLSSTEECMSQYPAVHVQFANSKRKFVQFKCLQHASLPPSCRLKSHHNYWCIFPSRKQVYFDCFISRGTVTEAPT